MKQSRIFTLLIAICLALFLVSFSIAAPIVCRPFYYAHIEPLQLCRRTGLTEAEIRTAYDEMLDYCLGGKTFSTGVLAFSPEGESHFTDVRGLFLLDLGVLAGSILCLLLLFGASRLFKRKPGTFLQRGPCFWAGAGLGGLFLIVGGLAALNFDRAFVIFHAIFFPGKSNWLFDPELDQIINILPEEFFRNCGILILAILIIGCIVLIRLDFLITRQEK